MQNPGKIEPGVVSGQQQPQCSNISGTVPIKKRRYPFIQLASPSREENPSRSEDNDPKNIHESNVCKERLTITDSEDAALNVKSVTRKTSGVKVNEEEVSATNKELQQTVGNTDIELELANANNSESKIPEGGQIAPLRPVDDVKNRMDLLSSGKYAEPKVPDSSITTPTTKVKQEKSSGKAEGNCYNGSSTTSMNTDLSLGLKQVFLDSENKRSELFCHTHKHDESDPSLLSLSLSNEKLDLHDASDIALDNVNGQVCASRSSWDLNKTMDVWEGSTTSEASVSRLVDTGVSGQTNSCHDNESYLSSGGTAVLSSDKGKGILVKDNVSSPNALKTDTYIGLNVAMPDRKLNASMEHSSFSNKSVSSVGSPNSISHEVHLSVLNLNRIVKSEPVEGNSKLDGCIDTCSSSNIGVNLSPTKSEILNTPKPETLLKPSTSLGLINHKPIKSEVFQLDNVGCCKHDTYGSVSRVMKHYECSACTSAIPEPLMPQNSFFPVLQTCSEVTTSGYFLNQPEHSFRMVESHDTIPNDERKMNMSSVSSSQVDDQSSISNLIDDSRFKLPPVEHPIETCHKSEVAVNAEEMTTMSTEMLEGDLLVSDCKSQENHIVDALVDLRENSCNEVDEELEDGEVKQHAAEDLIVQGNKTHNLQCVEHDTQNVHPPAIMGDADIGSHDADGKDVVEEDSDDPPGNPIKDSSRDTYELENEVNYLHTLSYKELEEADDNTSLKGLPDRRFDLSVTKNVADSEREELPCCGPTNDRHSIEIEPSGIATDKLVDEINSGKHDSTLCKVETSLDVHDKDNDAHGTGNKSRIINLSRGYVPSPGRGRAIQNRLLPSRIEKERYLDIDGELRSWGIRDGICSDGSKKIAKERFHEQTFRSPQPSIVSGMGKISNRFGPLHREWHPRHDFASETSYGSSNNHVIRRRQQEGNGYSSRKDDTSPGSNRRKAMNDEFPSPRNASLRRLSSGDRDGPASREFKILERIPRNTSPNRYPVKDGYNMVGFRHGGKFTRPQSDDITGPRYRGPQAIYDEHDDGPPMRGNRNFSAVQRKGYIRIRSKSPIRSRTRSPGPSQWSSPRRPSNGIQGLSDHQCPAIYRTGRIRSPDRACFRDEMVTRRRGSPTYDARHSNDFRDLGSGRDNVHPRSDYSNHRSPPARVFSRSSRRMDVLDSREVADGEEYINNGSLDSSNFHECHADGSINGRRKFIKRREPPFRPSCSSDNEGFSFHVKDGSRPYRFYQDSDTGFGERKREFDGGIKHQALLVARRLRDNEDNEDENYRPTERVWPDHGFNDSRVKRNRF